MKKVFSMVAICCLTMMSFVFTGCGETVTKDVAISYSTSFSYSGSGNDTVTDNGLTLGALQAIYFTAMKEMEGAIPLGDNSVYIKGQTSEKQVKEAVLAVGEKADKVVKAQYGDPVQVHHNYGDLSITLFHDWTSKPTATVTYKYK